MTTYHAVVWMDQEQAHVLHFDREHVEASRVRSRSHHKHQGRGSDRAAYFAAISAALGGSHEVLLAGPGCTREDFRKWVAAHLPAAAQFVVGSVAADHPTDGQLVALARQFFLRHDRMASDPSMA
ncbi:MAG: hypothetical protein EOO24_31715 [Comamonadaceae bacterium]|nr:MAG: hypothetical protein EOO24_31715 [Comamonadaceae bacterium]